MLKKLGKETRAVVQTMSEVQAGAVCLGIVLLVFALAYFAVS